MKPKLFRIEDLMCVKCRFFFSVLDDNDCDISFVKCRKFNHTFQNEREVLEVTCPAHEA